MPAFRPEVLAERERAALGAIVLIQPLSFAALTAATVVMAAAVLGFLATANYGRKARLAGTLVPAAGALRIDAPQGGRLAIRHAAEGEVLPAGAAIATIVDARATNDGVGVGELARHLSQERRRQLARERAETEHAIGRERTQHEARQASLAAEREQLDQETTLQSRREALAEAALERWRVLEARGIVSAAQRSQHEEAWLEHRSRSEAMRRARIVIERELALAHEAAAHAAAQGRARLASIDARAAEAARDDLERHARTEAVVVAPTPGVLAAWLAPEGQAIGGGEALASFLPEDGRLEAHFLAPSHAIGLLRPGQPVRLRYAAFPHQKYGSHPGHVLSVSSHGLNARELAGTAPGGSSAPAFRVRVAISQPSLRVNGESVALRPGMAVEADVEVDRRRLVDWALEPLLAVAGKV